MAVPVVEHSGGGTDSDTTVNVTIADTPTSDEVTILLITGAAAANLTLPSGWSWVPRMGGTAGVAGASTTARMWAIYHVGTPSDLTPDITMSAGSVFTWDYIIVSGVDKQMPFTSARYGQSSNSTSGMINVQQPGRPWVDCMHVTLAAADASDFAYTAGTYTQQRKSTNGSYSGYIITNVTDFTAKDIDGSTIGHTFDTAASARKAVVYCLLLTPSTTDLTSPVPFGYERKTQTSASPTTDGSLTEYGTTTPNGFLGDYIVPGMLILAGYASADESHTVSSVVLDTANSVGNTFAMTDSGLGQVDHSSGSANVTHQHWYKLLSHTDCTDDGYTAGSADVARVEWSLSGSITNGNFYHMCVAGAELTGPIHLAGSAEGGSSVTSFDPASITTELGEALIFFMGIAGTTAAFTEPGSCTSLWEGGSQRISAVWVEAAGSSVDLGSFSWATASYPLTSWWRINQRITGTPPSNDVAPAISGVPETGNTLSCSSGTWSGTLPITYTYQWKYYDGTWHDIGGATTSTWVVDISGAVDLTDTIKCEVTASNSAGSASADSNTTSPVTTLDFTDQFMGVSVN